MSTSQKFWNFSNRVYQNDDVQDACLALQNKYGLDVNLILFCCWSGALHGEFTEELFEQSLREALDWRQNVVEPLRNVRSWLKQEIHNRRFSANSSVMDFRAVVKATELESERLQQMDLERLIDHSSGSEFEPLNSSAKNLRRYCDRCGVDLTNDVKLLLALILDACLPDEGPDKALRALS